MTSSRRHVFISHRFIDDEAVNGLTKLLRAGGWDVRNSSVRAKEANQQRIERGDVPERTLQRLLRMKISWSQSVIVLIGSETHASKWVNYEIEEANKQGKKIVGVYMHGGQDAQIPESLEKYATSIVAWNTESIMSAIDGSDNKFENPDGSSRAPTNSSARQNC